MSRSLLCIMSLSACFSSFACDKEAATVSPDVAPAVDNTEAAQPEQDEEQEASPELVATYTALVKDVYSRDVERCLEEEMEAEDIRYMRAAYQLAITVTKEGTSAEIEASGVLVQVLNYGGQVQKEGNAEAMKACLEEAAKEWEFEPLPPSATRFEVSGAVGD